MLRISLKKKNILTNSLIIAMLIIGISACILVTFNSFWLFGIFCLVISIIILFILAATHKLPGKVVADKAKILDILQPFVENGEDSRQKIDEDIRVIVDVLEGLIR